MENFTVELTCLFCNSVLSGDLDLEFKSGDLIKCQSCGQENDYDSLLEVAKEKAIDMAKQEIESSLKDIFKGFK